MFENELFKFAYIYISVNKALKKHVTYEFCLTKKPENDL